LAGLKRSVGITAIHSISTIRSSWADRFTPIDALVGKSVFKILVTLVVYAMVFVHVGGKGRRLDHVRVITADGAQRSADVFAYLAQLGAHVTGMNRRSVLFASRCHARDEDKRPAVAATTCE
jgi:hypothetical protein